MERKDFLKLFSLLLFPSEFTKAFYTPLDKNYYIEMVEKSVFLHEKSFEFHKTKKGVLYSKNKNKLFVNSESFKEKDFSNLFNVLPPEGKNINFSFSEVKLNLFSLEKGVKFLKETSKYFKLIVYRDDFEEEEVFYNLNSKNRLILKNKLKSEHKIFDYDFKENVPIFFSNSSYGRILLRLLGEKYFDRVFLNFNFKKSLSLVFKKNIKNKPKKFIVVKDLSFKDGYVILKGNFLVYNENEFFIPRKIVIEIDEFFSSLYLDDKKREVYVVDDWRFHKISFYDIYLYGKKGVIL